MKSRFIVMFALALVLLSFGVDPVLAGNVVIKGSTTVLPIAQKESEVYMEQNPDVRISISGGGSGNGINALLDGTTDIADSSRFIKPTEVKLAVKRGIYPVPFAVAHDCIIPVVHPSNSIKDLSRSQLRAIYRGEIRNWKKVGGPDRPIAVISRDTSSGTYEVWRKKIMEEERVFPGALLQASNGAVVQAVSKNKDAIGYIGLGYLEKDIKALKVDGIMGSKETAINGTYPLSRPLYMFTNGWPTGDVLSFIRFILDPQKGQKYVSGIGYVPLY
ncbi:MAG: phosphate ABC transporter substrate-binding protein PstS family protein [Nitrospiraceae bacterium]|nr:phosphate ABC transporter substrate-binding protein PstS family protein [Nitrospiraceae bacterium]